MKTKYKIKRHAFEEYIKTNYTTLIEISKKAETSDSWICRLKDESDKSICSVKFARRLILAMGYKINDIPRFFYEIN